MRILLRWIAVIFFLYAGLNHFLKPDFYQRIVPPGFPAPKLLVIVSGVCEMAGGLGLFIPPLRRLAGWGLIALLIAVLPSNIYMAIHPERFEIARWMLWVRLPLQGIFIIWIWFVALGSR